MGTILSSKKDFNPALATQPRASIQISKFEVPDSFQQYPLLTSLSIPVPVRNTLPNIRTPVNWKEPFDSELNQTSIQQNPSPLIDQQSEEGQISSEVQLPLHRSSSYSFQPYWQSNNPTMEKDARIVYSSVVNLNHHRRMNNNRLSSFDSNRSIVERNGKQFVTEMKERMERRHVQVFDDTTGRMRLFEVLDYIPSRIVRSAKTNPQTQSHNNTSWNPPTSTSNQQSTLPAVTYKPTTTSSSSSSSSSSSTNSKGSNNRDAHVPSNKNISHARSAGHLSTNEYYQPKAYNNRNIISQEVSAQYLPGPQNYQTSSFRHHSPSGSEYSTSTSTGQSRTSEDGSDSEGYNPTLSSTDKRTTQIDPFERTLNTRDSYYRKRQDGHRYAQPGMKIPTFQSSGNPDYAPI